MRILPRYILREVIANAVVGMGVFTFVIFMRDAGRLLELVVRNSAPLPSVAELFFLTVPAALTVTIPMGVLVGILTGLSRLAADSEVTALRASGIGVMMFIKILGVAGIVVTFIAGINNILVAPRSLAALNDLQQHLKSAQASYEVQPRVFYEDWKNYILYVQDASAANGTAVWKGIFLADISNASAPKITLAKEGIAMQRSETELQLHLLTGAQHETNPRIPDKYSISSFESSDIPIVLPPPENSKANEPVPAAQLGMRELLGAAAHAPDKPAMRWYLSEFHRRIAMAFACFVLALVGIPLGVSAKKGGKATGFVLTIVLVFAYYFASLAGVTLARTGRMPPALGVWIPNIGFFIVALVLLWRVDRTAWEIGSFRAITHRAKDIFKAVMHRSSPSQDIYERLRRPRLFNINFPQLLDDYILRDFGIYLGLILSTFMVLILVFTFFELLTDIAKHRVPLFTVGEYLIQVAPSMLYLLTPLSVMLAVLITFGLLQKGSEITAMKATGVSIYRLTFPVLVLASLLSIGLFAFDQFYLPDANKRQEALLHTIKGKPAQTFLRPDRKWIFGQGSSIYYYEFFDPDQNHFANISVFEFDPKSFVITRRIFASEAHWQERSQKWIFENGWVRSFDGDAIKEFRKFDGQTFAELNEPPVYFKKEVKQSQEMNYAELSNYIEDLQQSGFDVVRLRVQLHKKFAFPLITLVMAVLAVPFSLSAGKRGAVAGVAVAIGIAVVYWTTSSLFEAMGNLSQLPPALAAWSPDLVFALVGGYFILKVPT
jgi:LPS export ABC transporter permease LptG/LPS export ABC transporter permease LptF